MSATKSDDDDNDKLNELTINTDYAAKYQLSQRQKLISKKSVKEVLQVMQQQTPDGELSSPSSSSEDEDDDGHLLTPNLDRQIMQTLERIRSHDPAVYDPNTVFYRDDDDQDQDQDQDDDNIEDDEDSEPTSKSKKRRSVREILAEQMIEEVLNPDAEHEDKPHYVPANEQAKARQMFVSANAGSESDDDLELIRKEMPQDLKQDEYDAFVADTERKRKNAPVSESRTLRRYDQEEGLSAEDQFLKEYISGEWWKDHRPAGYTDTGLIRSMRPEQITDQTDDLSADEQFLEAQDQFEANYNFRFEEPGGTQLVTHPRNINDSVRRVDDRRARKREKRKAAKLAAKQRQIEELKRSKNQRKQELIEQAEREELQKLQEMRAQMVAERLNTIADFVGADVAANDEKRSAILSQLDLDGEFNLEEYDRKMTAVFDDEFYDASEADDDLFVQKDVELESTSNDINEKVAEDSKKKRPRLESEKMLEELYAMDFEDTIGGDLRTRFRYTQVPAHSFGMSVEEILNTDDKELQKRVSIKQLAPYRTDRNLKQSWQQLKAARNSRFRRKQARAGTQPQFSS